MTISRFSLLVAVLIACESSPAAPEAEADASAESAGPITAEIDKTQGIVTLSADVDTTQAMLGPIAMEACKGLREGQTDVNECVWKTDYGPQVTLDADGTAKLVFDLSQMTVTGAWEAGDNVRPFMIGNPAMTQLDWDHAPRPDDVGAEVPAVLQITKEAPRAGLLLGSDKVIHGFTEGSTAPAAGLKQGDEVVSLNGDASLADDAQTFVKNLPKKPGKVAKIGVKRGEETLLIKLPMTAYWQCHKVWSDTAVPSVVDEPTGPSIPVSCPGWAPSLVAPK